MAHKWKVGDRARFVYSRRADDFAWQVGDEVVIVGFLGDEDNIGDLGLPNDVDVIRVKDGEYGGVIFDQLEPIIDLGDASEKEESVPVGSWGELQKSIGWNPTKQKELV